MGKTLVEKIFSRAAGKEVKAGDNVTAKVDLAMSHEAMAGVYQVLREAGIEEIWDPSRVVVLLDHYVPAPTVQAAQIHQLVRQAVEKFRIGHYYGEGRGVCHQIMMELGHVKPGLLIVGTDSHSTSYGALAAAGTGLGTTEMAYVMAAGEIWFKIPETIQFYLEGEVQDRVMSKDILLFIAGSFGTEVAQYKAIEFLGPVAQQMSVSSRMTMSNMAVEIGAKFGFFPVDQKTIDFLKYRYLLDTEEVSKWTPDAKAVYESIYRIDISGIPPQVAVPHSIDKVKPVSEVRGIKINQAVLASCTNARYEDLAVAAEILAGHKINPHVRFYVTPASTGIYRQAMSDGILETLLDSGAIVCNPSCGPCMGGHLGILAPGEKCISSTNRNFRGRMGSDEAEVYLASPATVAASALNGEITDPREI